MKSSLSVRLISDVHLPAIIEKGSVQEAVLQILEKTKRPGVLILAGDIGDTYSESFRRFISAAAKSSEYCIFVPGNHEYYTDGAKDMATVKENLARICRNEGIILLDNSDKVIEGYRFIGSTCWPVIPEEQYKVLKRESYGLVTKITRDSHKLDFSDFKKMHDQDVAYLKSSIRASKEPAVIITHYPPSSYMIQDGYEHNPHIGIHYNAGLLEQIALQDSVPLWLCGHCHTGKKMWMKGQKILLAANCLMGDEFNRDFVVTL